MKVTGKEHFETLLSQVRVMVGEWSIAGLCAPGANGPLHTPPGLVACGPTTVGN